MRAKVGLIGVVFLMLAGASGCGVPGWFQVDRWSQKPDGTFVAGSHNCKWVVGYSGRTATVISKHDTTPGYPPCGPNDFAVTKVRCVYQGQVGGPAQLEYSGSTCPATVQPANALFVEMAQAYVQRK